VRKLGILIALIFLAIGFGGWIGGLLINQGLINYSNEVPLGHPSGLVVDEEGNIYIGLAFYGKIQVYNSDGVFLRNWHAGASGGAFNMAISENQNIIVSTARGDKQIVFDKLGKVISEKTIESIYSETRNSKLEYITKDGKIYQDTGAFFPKIGILSPEERTIVDQNVILKIMQGPMPIWIIGAMGLGGMILLSKKRLNKNLK